MVTVQGDDDVRTMREARIDAVGWGVLFVVVGAVLLVPGLPDVAWVAAAGVVMVGTSLVRAWLGMDVPWFTALAGTAALIGGGAGLLGFENEGWPLVLVATGLVVVARAFHRSDRPATFGATVRAGR